MDKCKLKLSECNEGLSSLCIGCLKTELSELKSSFQIEVIRRKEAYARGMDKAEQHLKKSNDDLLHERDDLKADIATLKTAIENICYSLDENDDRYVGDAIRDAGELIGWEK